MVVQQLFVINSEEKFSILFLRSFAGGNSKETVGHSVMHVQCLMHVVCVALAEFAIAFVH